MSELQKHEKRLEKAEKYIAMQMKEVKETLQDFFVKHEAVREVKRVNDKAYYKEKDKERAVLIAEEKEYRRKRDERIEEFQETVHKIDLEWEEKMRQYYEDQYN